MNEIFISYSRKDKAFAQKLAEALIGTGRDPWVDWEDIPLTADWWAEIQRGIEGAHTFVFIISPDSVASTVCAQEIEHATAHNKRVIPVVHRDAKDVPHTLTHLNWVFFRETEDFETAFQALLRSIDTDLDWVKAHTRLTVRAVEWESHERNDSYVLRGDDLKQAERRLAETDKEPKLTGFQVQYVAASQQSAIRRQRRALAAVAFGLLAASILGCIAFLNFQASRREANLRLQAEAEAEEASAARATAVVVQQTAEGQADVAVVRAREAQAQALVAETAQAQALVAEATAVAARENAETDRQAAVAAGATAQTARQIAQTQQAQAEGGLEEAVVAQQTAQAAQEEAILAQQTALAGEATAEASQATAVAGQGTAMAQQATAVAGQATAQAQQSQAEAAAQQAAQAQAAAEAALAEAEAAKKEAEDAKAAAEAEKEQAEADKATAQAELIAVNNLRATVEAELAQAQNLVDEARLAKFVGKYMRSCAYLIANTLVAMTYEEDYIWVSTPQAASTEFFRIRASDCNVPFSATFSIPDPSIVDLAYGQGYIWSVSSNNRLYKADPSGTIHLDLAPDPPGNQPVALLFARGSIWLVSTGSNTLLQLAPRNGQRLKTYTIGNDPVDLVDDGTYIWVASRNKTLSRIDPASGASLTVPLMDEPKALTYGGGYIWVSLDFGGPIQKIEAATGSSKGSFDPGGGIAALAFDTSHLWLHNISADEVIKVQPEDYSPLSTNFLNSGSQKYYGSMFFDGVNLWVLSQGFEGGYYVAILYKIPIHAAIAGSGTGDMVEDGDYIWVINSFSNSLTKVRAATGTPLLEVKVGKLPTDLVLTKDYMWVLNSGDNTLLKLRRSDAQLLSVVSLKKGDAYDLNYDGTHLWLAYSDAVARVRESDEAWLGISPLPDSSARELLYDGDNIWSSSPLQKLSPEGAVVQTYPLELLHPVVQKPYFWGISAIDFSSSPTAFTVSQIDPRLAPLANFVINQANLTTVSPVGLGTAHGGGYIWTNGWRIPVSNPGEAIPFTAAVCKDAQFPLYHAKTRTVWVSCSIDNAIQKIYSLDSPLNSATVSAAAPDPADSALYLPLIIKGQAPLTQGVQPFVTPAPMATTIGSQ